ncbi:MAG: DNA-directed RNA polymerase subunit beta' [Clostridiales bacterium]|nr:DNA-directed RNA polymerase subunit beta' [Clostridiales bacterium]
MFELSNFYAMKIGLASPEKIREWSYGEVTKSETINYRTQKPERDGLFCERIFGPRKDYECHCGKYKRIRYKGVICDKCGVEVTVSSVRRERMGHIELATPVSHIWFFKINPSKIGQCLDISSKNLEAVLYYVNYIVIDAGNTDFEKKQVITDREYRDAVEKFGAGSFKAGMGAEAIKELLKEINIEEECRILKAEMATSKGQKRLKIIKRYEIMESFLQSGNRPEWMILDCIPVIPPDLRPMVQLDGGRFATNDLNDLYRRVIQRNARLKKLLEIGAPDVIVRNEKRMLQESVDALFDNGKRGKPVVGGSKNRELKSITSSLKGKQGRFRLNLLGKRVDYSGRAVIIIGPELKIYQCGLPKQMALELFKPFIMKRLVEMNQTYNIKSAKRMVEREKPIVWDVLDEVIKDHPVLLNRAPTLHKLSIQAFEPVLCEGNAIKLHPLVCAGFNADFDGDQMAVHVPLGAEACAEARFLMLASNNIVKPSDGKPIVTPQQDIVLGTYFLTMVNPNAKGANRVFVDEDEALNAYLLRDINLQAPILVRRKGELNGKTYQKLVKTTVGKIIINNVVPQDLGYVDRENEETFLEYEINKIVGKDELGDIVAKVYNIHGTTPTAKFLDEIKALGYKYSTLSGITMNLFDMSIPEARQTIIAETEKLVEQNEKLYNRGLITLNEKINKNISLWEKATGDISLAVRKNLGEFNPLNIIATSKARMNPDQLKQVCGMRGILAAVGGAKIEIPVKSNYRLGLKPFEYFMSSRGGRKGLADTALKTADAGYLTRKLVDVSQSVIVNEEDCFASNNEKIKGAVVSSITVDDTLVCTLKQRIVGRVAVDDVINPNTKEVIVKSNEMITEKQADLIEACGIKSVAIRTVLTCRCKNGVCAKCYGKDMSSDKMIGIGEAVGIIAAQSVGEPGTQLTMKNFHTGGVATAVDITTGLPRVEELFEAKRPKGMAMLCEVAGKVTVNKVDKLDEVVVHSSEGDVSYLLPYGSVLKVKTGDTVVPGTPLSAGSIYPNDILRTQGVKAVQEYLINQILYAYSKNSVNINTKHLEVIIRQMLKKVMIEDQGDTEFLPSSYVDIFAFEEANDKVLREGKVPASSKRTLLGITKAALNSESFLSAASFQETPMVLTEAAIKGKVDKLEGLKENVIIGKLIPAGTGNFNHVNVYPKFNNKEIVNTDSDVTNLD